MEPEELERKIRQIIMHSRNKRPMLRVIKNTGEAKFGVYIQLGDIEGAGKALFTRAGKEFMFPLHEIRDVDYVSKEMACEALNRPELLNLESG